MEQTISDIAIDRRTSTPLFRQVYAALSTAIVDGRLPAGARLPASRALAEQLDLSRTVVVAAYEQLLAEGYATGRIGSGTYVAPDLPERPGGRAPIAKTRRTAGSGAPRLAGKVDVTLHSDDRPFNLGRTVIYQRTADQSGERREVMHGCSIEARRIISKPIMAHDCALSPS